jgi:Protein of unknown function (DUF4089)
MNHRDTEDTEEEVEERLIVREYVEQMALLLDLDLRDEYKDGVVANFKRINAIAQIVSDFDLPENIDVAPIFEP